MRKNIHTPVLRKALKEAAVLFEMILHEGKGSAEKPVVKKETNICKEQADEKEKTGGLDKKSNPGRHTTELRKAYQRKRRKPRVKR